jgi:hypothetical protein
MDEKLRAEVNQVFTPGLPIKGGNAMRIPRSSIAFKPRSTLPENERMRGDSKQKP